MTYTPIPRGTQNWDVPLNSALAQLDANITTASGTALQAANNLSDLTNAPQARINLGLTGLANALSNMTATSNPAVTSDNTQGYSIGSTWFNTTTNAMFVATSVATGAAVWLQIPPTFVDRTTSQSIAGVKTFTSTMNSSQAGDTSALSATYSANNPNNGAFTMNANTNTGRYLDSRVSGDTTGRYTVLSDGTSSWGPGNAARDTNLYRGGVGILKTDNDLQAANFTPGVWTTYTPAWTTNGTAPVIGNGTLTGRYSITGNTVNLHINLTGGSTTTYGSGDLQFGLPFAVAASGVSYIGHVELLDTTRWAGQVVLSTGASSTTPFMSTSATDPRLLSLQNTRPITGGLSTSAQIRITAAYEMA